MRAYKPQQPFGLSEKNRRGAPCLGTGLLTPGYFELPNRNQRGLWICGQFACGEPGRLPWKTLHVSHRASLCPQAPQTIVRYIYSKTEHTRVLPAGRMNRRSANKMPEEWRIHLHTGTVACGTPIDAASRTMASGRRNWPEISRGSRVSRREARVWACAWLAARLPSARFAKANLD